MTETLALCEALEAFLDEKKAFDITRICLGKNSPIADYFLIASGNSERQIVSLADHVRVWLKTQGISSSMRGLGEKSWVIVDVGFLMVHLFLPEKRAEYDLEELWRSVPPPALRVEF